VESNEIGSLSDAVVDAVSNANFKVLADKPAMLSALAYEDLLAHRKVLMDEQANSVRNVNAIREKALAKSLESMDHPNPTEAAGESKMAYPGHDLGAQIAALSESLGTALVALQQFAKVGQTTPPTT
jgi:hypothetical protein